MKSKKTFLLLIIFLSLVLILTILLKVFYRQKVVKEKAKSFNNHLVAPYYKKTDFVVPKEVIKETTASAQLKIPIIMYHYVENIKDVNDLIRKRLDTSPAFFDSQLKSLNEAGYKTYFVKDVPDILSGKINYSTNSAILTFDDGYEDFYTVVLPILKKYQMKATLYIIYDFIGRNGFLNKNQIKEIIDSGLVEIGSHTLDHLYLKLMSDSVAKKQIFESKKKLEEDFGIKVETFAYPYGAFSKKTIDLVKEAGYQAVVSVIPSMQQSEDNLFYLGRVRSGVFSPKTIVKTIENFKK